MALPQEIIQQIASYADDETKRTIRLASTKLFELVNYTNFRIYCAQSRTLPAIITRFSHYQTLIGLTFEYPRISAEELVQVSILTNLSSLAVYGSYFRTTPEVWLQLTALRSLLHLKVFGDKPFKLMASISGLTEVEIADRNADLSTIAKLTNIRVLSIAAIKDQPVHHILDEIPRPWLLTSLYIHGESFVYTADQVSRFSNLKVLEIRNQIVPVHTLTSLERLQTNKHVDTFNTLTNLTSLKLTQSFVDIPDSIVQSAIRSITSLVRLKELGITERINNFDLEILHPLTASENLNLGSCNFSSKSLKSITSTRLTSLHTCLPQLHRSDISHLTHLQRLVIDNNRHHLPLAPLQDLANLTGLFANDGQLTDDLAHLTALKSLRRLTGFIIPADALQFLGANVEQLSFDVPSSDYSESYALLTRFSLTSLHIEGPLNDNHKIWSTLGKLTDLMALSVSTAESDADIDNLAPLTRLTSLSVGGTFTPTPFKKLSSLRNLYVTSTYSAFNYEELKDIPHLRSW